MGYGGGGKGYGGGGKGYGGKGYGGGGKGYGGGGKGFGGGGGSMKGGGGGKGGGRGKGKGGVPFWRQFVDPSDDPDIVHYCQEQIGSFLASSETQRQLENLPNPHRNTLRHMAPAQGVGWIKVSKGVFALVKLAPATDSASSLRALVAGVRACCEASGGKCAASSALKRLSPGLITFLQASLRLRGLKELPSHQAASLEMKAQGVRLNQRGNGFVLDGVEDDDAWHVQFDPRVLGGARAAIDAALRAMPPTPRAHHASARPHGSHAAVSARFLSGHPTAASPRELELETSSSAYVAMLHERSRHTISATSKIE